ncbi:omega-hydroxyceramide transacylase-like [Penaeus japonicus]|uniref:omega-hydroxyceramide transacylase-like n=1 Tax=Penaeus japonicus TaxID=27405 RepID=UPI001C70D799|nr:omega-hydroxyceramide transacylase-like [Penaeus japonicus]
MQEHHPSLLCRKLGGSSFGSIVAASVACGIPLQHIRRILIAEVKRVRKTFLGAFNPYYKLEEPLINALLEVMPADAHIRASGRVFLSLTSVTTFASEVVSQYSSRDELIRAILCCCFLPYLSGFSAPSFRGRRYMDGGFSNIKPLDGPSIISINAFSGSFEICPPDPIGERRPLNPFMGLCVSMSQENLFKLKWGIQPPEPEVLDQFFHFGYFHARNFLNPGGSKVPRSVVCKAEESENCKGSVMDESVCACAC